MVNFNKKVVVLIAIVFSLCCIQLASAAIYYTPTYANRSENFMLNITISAPENTNISQIVVQDISTMMPFSPTLGSNSSSINTTAGLLNFIYIAQSKVYTWYNLTGIGPGLIANLTNQSFTITLSHSLAGTPAARAFYVCVYNTTNITRHCDNIAGMNQVENTTITIGMNFGFSGYIKNDSGDYQLGTNITIYDYVTSAGGPPSEVPLASTTTDSNGMFRLWGINGSKNNYKIKLFYNNSAGRAMLVGPNLPPFPSNMFYSMPAPPGAENMPMFKKMPNINGTTFYLQQAATINISAVANVPDSNSTSNSVQFGYEVMDQAVGFPVESNVRNGVWSKQVVVPIGRSYTVITMRDPNTFTNYDWCHELNEINDSACGSPPVSTEVLSANLTQGGLVNIELNLSYTMHSLSGCINLSGNTSLINITNVITRLTPWTGFVPPIDAKISAFNITNSTTGYAGNIVYGDQKKCAGYNIFYNISLMGSSSGTKYLLEFYGKNAADEAGNPGSAVNLAAFQNLTMNESHKFMNITLKPLAGAYATSATLNTSKMKIFVHNSSGSASGNAITTSMHVEVKVKHPVFGTMHYILEDISGGITYLPILANSTWAKVSVYPNEAPPVEKTLNLAATQNNITVQVGEFTFRKPLTNGSLDSQGINVSNKDTDGITMTFYRNAAGCNTPNPPTSCVLTQTSANDFNPMTVMMAGKVNLEMKMNASNTALYFINFDLLAAKPPTNSIMSNNASKASANAQTWEQGSFVPHVYDHAFVVTTYSVTSGDSNYINESYSTFNISLPYLRDENWNVAWNGTNGSTTSSLPDDYTDFNTGSYAPLLSTAGAACSTTNMSDACYWDKGNDSFVMKVPHFSGVGSSITGTAPAAGSSSTPPSGGSSSGGTSAVDVSESRTFSNIAADSENTYRISNPEGIGVNALVFTATEALENVKVEITKLVSKPSSVSPDPSGSPYKYIKIDAPKLEGKLKQAVIQFEVTTAWLNGNDYEPEHIRLARFADGSWRELTTSILSEETSKVYYEAISPGFSYFAIIAKKAAEEEAPAANVTAPGEEPVAPEITPAAEEAKESAAGKLVKPLLIIVGVLVVLFIAVLGYKKKSSLIFWREPTDKERQEYVRGEFLKRKKQQSFGSGD